jgi:purine-nucleoside/S-methyl-5'-thioadenosine phosphorylase / adenosine deaminase
VTDSFRLGEDGIYRCDAFQEYVWQSHGFGTRLGNPRVNVTLRQIHSSEIQDAKGLADRAGQGDGLATNEISLAIGVRTADCVPILLLDTGRRAVAAVHAGWRGTAAAISQHAVARMGEWFKTEPGDVYAAIGPSIRACCYEVGMEVASAFTQLFPEWPAVAGKRHLDLAEANRRQLQTAGIPAAHISDCGLCTSCLPEQFFSFRREPFNPGRMLSAICRLA